jgi:hypothetical protein
MVTKKKTGTPETARTKPPVVVTVDDTAKSEEVAAEASATAPLAEEEVKEEKDKKDKKGKKGKKGKKDKKDKKGKKDKKDKKK